MQRQQPKAIASEFTDIPMSAYQRALADRHMYVASILADLTLRTSIRLRSIAAAVRKLCTSASFSRFEYLKNGVVHTD